MFLSFVCKARGLILLYNFGNYLFEYIWSYLTNSTVWEKIENKFVVVTGATQGIGKEICKQLAFRKVKLLMIDNNKDKLESLKNELASQIECEFYVIDFKITAENYNVFSFLEDYDVAVLINAATTADRGVESFLNRRNDVIIQTNILSTVHITHRVAAQMTEKKLGYILFIGDSAFDIPVPYIAVYSATLAFLNQFASSLYYEINKYGIVVEYINYSPVLKAQLDTYNSIDTKKFVTSLFKTFGSNRRIIPRLKHIFWQCIVDLIPRWIIGRYKSNIHEKIELKREFLEQKKKQ
ncbi:hypothetical protein NCER_101810 [Vairimorpha ceranae BRL01]|uniref:Uncharacterized protein n=2 Tax=Vairimorpha ceranae TaxID=40302 RepID=C4VAT5_VAIC1|nr:estradiol 17-beta-dehydrogenase 12 [Vairimorpha ceranae]EEQ81667.1 hypothetical protein NCER_101810 [Vairimorpha ceranae BRL01]KKO76541.1 estradiol 17-beta-dehydrogenase 12 [Vairimorpha ceranae]